MSRPLMKKVILFSSIGFLVGLLAMAALNKTSKQTEGSLMMASKTFNPGIPQGKHLSVIQVSLQAPEGIPESETDAVTLTGWVRLNQAVQNDLKIRWELPEGVVAIEGSPEESLTNVPVGQTMEIKLTVKGFSKESLKLITLHGFIDAGDSQLGNSAVLTSRPEDSFEMLRTTASTDEGPQEKSLLQGAIQR